MKPNKKWRNLTAASLEKILRRLPQIKPPDGLEHKLLEVVPQSPEQTAVRLQGRWHLMASRFTATVAAAIFILALMLVINYGLSAPEGMSLAQFDETVPLYSRLDQNNLMYKHNGLVERSVPANLLRQMTDQNEI
jgi:hypothetical protein